MLRQATYKQENVENKKDIGLCRISGVNDNGAHWRSEVSTSSLPDGIFQGVGLSSELSVLIPGTNCCIWCGYKGGKLGWVLAKILLVSHDTPVATVGTCTSFRRSQPFPVW